MVVTKSSQEKTLLNA